MSNRLYLVFCLSRTIAALILLLVVGVAQISQAELACLRNSSGSFVVESIDGVESPVKVKQLVKRTKKRIRSTKKSVKRTNRKINGLKRTRRRKKGEAKKLEVQARIDSLILKRETIAARIIELRSNLQLPKECSGDGLAKSSPNILEVDSFSLASGEAMLVESDLTIRSVGSVSISGDLSAAAGSGADIVLSSQSGDIVLTSGARVGAGDGATGEVSNASALSPRERSAGSLILAATASGGRGANGGSVSLIAPGGKLVVNEGATIHVGNGGVGADLVFPSNDSVRTEDESPFQLENGGGSSGALIVDVLTIEGLDVEDTTVTDPDTGLPVPGRVLTSFMGISGGIGGDAGKFSVEEVASAQVTPMAKNAADPLFGVSVSGATGGSGLTAAGKGQDVVLIGKDGTVPTQAGQDVRAFGGRGGDCLPDPNRLIEAGKALVPGTVCFPGIGGDAFAKGGDGADGEVVEIFSNEVNGAEGGDALARNGRGGTSFTFDIVHARNGIADATAGNGGDGAGRCPSRLMTGGKGGDGGDAEAKIFQSFHSTEVEFEGKGTARGGRGGRAGDGDEAAGSPGRGGAASVSARFDSNETDIDGLDGDEGIACNPRIADGTPLACFSLHSLATQYYAVGEDGDDIQSGSTAPNTCGKIVVTAQPVTRPDGELAFGVSLPGGGFNQFFSLASPTATSSSSTSDVPVNDFQELCTCSISKCGWASKPLLGDPSSDSFGCGASATCLSHSFELSCDCNGTTCTERFVNLVDQITE